MNELTRSLNEGLKIYSENNKYEILGIIPIPSRTESHTSRMTRRTLIQELFDEIDESNVPGTLEYLVQIKQNNGQIDPQLNKNTDHIEPIYLQKNKSKGENTQAKINAPFLIKNAEILCAAHEYALAKNIYKALILSGETTGQIFLGIGKCFEADHMIEEAIANYRESIIYQPTFEAHQLLIRLFNLQSRYTEAGETICRALALKELSHSMQFELFKAGGNAWFKGQRYDQAQHHFMKALELNPTADEVRSNLGVLCLKTNRITDAKRHFQDALASNTENYRALAGLGSAFFAEKDYESAQHYFAKSLEIELHSPMTLFNLTQCVYQSKKYELAIKFLEKYCQNAPVTPSLLYSLAGLQYQVGQVARAKQTTQKILELQSQHVGATELLRMIDRYQVK